MWEIYAMLWRYGKTALIVVLGCVAAGCAVVGDVNIVQTLSKNSEVAEDQGIVIARVICAGSVPLPFNYLTITPKNVNESAEIKPTRLQAMNGTAAKTSLFASPVAAGSYTLSNIRAFYTIGDSWYSRWAEAEIELGTFTVQPGGITDLGTIIYYPKVSEDRYLDMVMRSPNSSAFSTVVNYLPNLKTNESMINSWDEDEFTTDRFSRYASAVQNPVVFNKRYYAADGSLYFIGKLGAILNRSEQGDWQLDAVASESDLNAIAVNDTGDIIVGGEFGKIFFKPLGGSWKDISIDGRYNIHEVLFSQDGKTADIVAKKYKSVSVFRGNITQPAISWEELASYISQDGWRDAQGNATGVGANSEKSPPNARIAYVHTVQRNGKYYLFLGTQVGTNDYLFAAQTNKIFTFDRANWQMTESKGFHKGLDTILPAGTTEVGIKEPGFWSFNGKSTYFRFDKASDDWIKVDTRIDGCPNASEKSMYCKGNRKPLKRYTNFDFLSVPIYSSASDALAIVKYRNPKTWEYDIIIATTSDGGSNWQPSNLELPSKYCVSTVPELTDALLIYCNGISSDFYESQDHGKTWEQVREHQNF